MMCSLLRCLLILSCVCSISALHIRTHNRMEHMVYGKCEAQGGHCIAASCENQIPNICPNGNMCCGVSSKCTGTCAAVSCVHLAEGTCSNGLSCCTSALPPPAPTQPNDGKKFTTSPNERTTTRTKATPAQIVAAIMKAWPEITAQAARVYASQWAQETGMSSCWNWNLGNVKAGSADVPHMYLHGVWECGVSGGRDPTPAEQKKWNCGGKKLTVFDPPSPAARFRAYDSLDEGVAAWIGKHKKYAEKIPGYKEAAAKGDAEAIASFLKKQSYYSGSEAQYKAGMKKYTTQFNNEKLGEK